MKSSDKNCGIMRDGDRDGHELDIAAEGSSLSKRFKRRSRLRIGKERVDRRRRVT